MVLAPDETHRSRGPRNGEGLPPSMSTMHVSAWYGRGKGPASLAGQWDRGVMCTDRTLVRGWRLRLVRTPDFRRVVAAHLGHRRSFPHPPTQRSGMYRRISPPR